jgi:acetyltransferase-like isoleucine patch superfamily enzyme
MGFRSKSSKIQAPSQVYNLQNVFLYDFVRIMHNSQIINNTGKFIVKKYSAIAANFVAVVGMHVPTVGVPHSLLGISHVNDVERDMIIEEGVWIGANATLLLGAHIGRGSIIGACSLVNTEIPPYAVAVGTPAKVISSVFTIDQIIEHEKILYPEEERFSREYLEQIFEQYYKRKKSIGIPTISEQDRMILKEVGIQSGYQLSFLQNYIAH